MMPPMMSRLLSWLHDGVRGGLRRVSRVSGLFHPMTFLLLYFGLTVLFALLYRSMPRDFYHDSASHEPAHTEHRLAVVTGLNEFLQERVNDSPRAVPFPGTSLSICPQDMFFDDIRPSALDDPFDGQYQSLQATLYVSIYDEMWSRIGHIPFIVSLAVDRDRAPTDYFLARVSETTLGSEFVNDAVTDFARRYVTSVMSDSLLGHSLCRIWVSRAVDDAAHSHALSAQGYSFFDEHAMSRALYFSVVTITTLGYGDIIPLTDKARTLVATEAFLGVLTVGLFLTALADRLATRTAHRVDMDEPGHKLGPR